MRPLTMRAGGRNRRRMAIALTDLPEPDSPTRPTTSPAAMLSAAPSTAWTTPSSVSKWTVRSSMVRRSVTRRPSHALHSRIQHVAQRVADQVEREHRGHDGHAGEEEDPPLPGDDVPGALGGHRPPLARRRPDAEADIRERGDREDGEAHGQCRLDDDGRKAIGQQVVEDDAPLPVA